MLLKLGAEKDVVDFVRTSFVSLVACPNVVRVRGAMGCQRTGAACGDVSSEDGPRCRQSSERSVFVFFRSLLPRPQDGVTAMHVAAASGHSTCLEKLLHARADPCIKDRVRKQARRRTVEARDGPCPYP